jgi:tetratricopeptide (TPR) repeat protein
MAEVAKEFRSLMAMPSVASLDNEAALDHVGRLVDLSGDLRESGGLQRALELAEQLRQRGLTPAERATLNYFSANAWSKLTDLAGSPGASSWNWEQHELQEEVLNLRRALEPEGFAQLPESRRCQILTNLGNVYDTIGRFVEAVEYWDRALAITPSFPMAIGNRGKGRVCYARALYDRGQAVVFLKHAHRDLATALASELEGEASAAFEDARLWIESVLPSQFLGEAVDMERFSLGRSRRERAYRQWCLDHRLFLNPLNDLGPYPIAAHDCFTTPSIVVGIGEGPYYPGFFNQMKQEFVSARYLYYEGLHAKSPHFSDRGVLLYNTLDYPAYSLSVEKVKAAFRTCYSLLDKVAFFLNHYLRLGIPERMVNLRSVWYDGGYSERGLKPEFEDRANWALRGLYWLSKDVYEQQSAFGDATDPNARQVYELRRRLEHRYLKLHEDLWRGPPHTNDDVMMGLADTLAYSLYRADFHERTLGLLKLVRAALIYLSLAVLEEERTRQRGKGSAGIVPGIPLGVWQDRWKV